MTYNVFGGMIKPYSIQSNTGKVKFTKQHFSVKNAIILCSFMFAAEENRKSSPIIKFTVLPFWHCYFERSNHK